MHTKIVPAPAVAAGMALCTQKMCRLFRPPLRGGRWQTPVQASQACSLHHPAGERTALGCASEAAAANSRIVACVVVLQTTLQPGPPQSAQHRTLSVTRSGMCTD